MEDAQVGRQGLRTGPLGVGSPRLEGPRIPPRGGSLPRGGRPGFSFRSLLRGLRAVLHVGLLAVALASPAKATLHSDLQYTGAPFNFCLPGYDSYDWQECWDFNWGVINSSFTVLSSAVDAVSASTASIAASTTTLKAAMDTKLSSGAIPSGFVDLSTVTTALALKADLTGGVFSGHVRAPSLSINMAQVGTDVFATSGTVLHYSTSPAQGHNPWILHNSAGVAVASFSVVASNNSVDLYVDGDIHAQDDLEASGGVFANANSTFELNVGVGRDLTVDDDATISDWATIGSSLTVGPNLITQSSGTFAALRVSGTAVFQSSINSSGGFFGGSGNFWNGLSHVETNSSQGTHINFSQSSVTVTAATIQNIIEGTERGRYNPTGLHVNGVVTASSASVLGAGGLDVTYGVSVGSFTVASGTMTVAEGVVSAPSQHHITLSSPTNNAGASSAEWDVYWTKVDSGTASMFEITVDSSAIKVKSAGLYLVTCQISFIVSNTVQRTIIYHNNDELARSLVDPISGGTSSSQAMKFARAAVNDTFSCATQQNSGARAYPDTDKSDSFFQAVKLW